MQAAPICYHLACVKHWISLGKAFIGLVSCTCSILQVLYGARALELSSVLGMLQILSVSLTLQ